MIPATLELFSKTWIYFPNEQFYLSKSFVISFLISYDCWKLILNIQYYPEFMEFYGRLSN